MSKIEGRAKKYDGTPVDYVSIFNWSDGQCIAQVIPDSNGIWSYDYSQDLNCGITYVADGCQPITHGSYEFVVEVVPDVYGYLFICYAISGNNEGSLDVTNTTHSDWNKNFKYASGISLLKYSHSPSGVAESIIPATTVAVFDINWILELRAVNFNSNLGAHSWTIEFLSTDGSVIAAVKSQSAPNKTSQIWYGPNLMSLTKTSTPTGAGSFGELSFTDTKMLYKNTGGSTNNPSFSLNADFSSVVAVRVSGNAKAEMDSAATNYSGGYLKVISPIIT